MFQKKRSKLKGENIAKIIVAIIAVGGTSFIGFLSLFLYNNNLNVEHFVNGFDVQLTPESVIDYDYLYDIVNKSEKLIGLYHIPKNLTGNNWTLPPIGVSFNYELINQNLTFFNSSFFNNSQLLNEFDPLDLNSPYNNKSIMVYGGDTDHVSLYSGVYVAGEAFRYAVAKRENNRDEVEATLERLRDLVLAYEILSEVAGNFTWPRYAVPNTPLAREKFPGYGFTASKDRHIVEYRGFNWSLIGHKSRDVTCGQLFAMSMVYNLVDDPDLKERTGRIIDRTVSYLYDSNWRIFDVTGKQHTTASELMNMRPHPSSLFVLSFLKMAAIVNPDKWQPIYLHYAYDRGFAKNLGKDDRVGLGYPSSNVAGSYYSMNFIYNDVPTLIWLEKDDPVLKQIYLDNLLDSAQNFAKFHRNGMFDAVYLLCHSTPDFDNLSKVPTLLKNDINDDDQIWGKVRDKIADPLEFIKSDIKDCLWRSVNRKYPYRTYYNDVFNFPNQHQTPIPNVPYPKVAYWEGTSFDLIGSIEDTFGGKESPSERNLLNNSMPVDMRKTESMMWQRKSYGVKNVNYVRGDQRYGWTQLVPDILVVYWLARYLNIIPKSN